jgi:hypothetical protein
LYYELEILDDLVLNKLTPSTSFHNNLALEEYLSIAHTENLRIKKSLINNVLSLNDSSHYQLLIQSLQRELTILADHLYTKIGLEDSLFEKDEEDISLKSVQKITFFIIDDLILYLKDQFGAYFNFDGKPTKPNILNAISSLTMGICELQALSQEPNTFLNAIVSEITDSITLPQTLTYRHIEFLEQLIANITSEKKRDHDTELSQFVIERIIYCNFNDPGLIKLITRHYQRTIDAIDQETYKIEKLLWFLKVTHQTPVHPQMVFLYGQKSAQEQLSIWICEELSFYEKRDIKLSDSEKDIIKKFAAGYKIGINSSSDDFGFFTRVLFEVGAYNGVEVTDLFEFYSTFYHTKGTLNNSAKGMRGGYYTISQSTVTRVKTFVFKMIRYIQDNYPGIIMYTSTFFSFEVFSMTP